MGWQALKVFEGVESVLVVVSPHHEHELIWSNEFDRPTMAEATLSSRDAFIRSTKAFPVEQRTRLVYEHFFQRIASLEYDC